jgi:predicted PurR-regulated permease PerM
MFFENNIFMLTTLKELKNIKRLLIIIVVLFIFYLLKILSIIFIPLVFALFFALLTYPLLRWFHKRKVPKALSLFIVVLLIAISLIIIVKLTQMASREILAANTDLLAKAQIKLRVTILSLEDFLRLKELGKEGLIVSAIQDINIAGNLLKYSGAAMNRIWELITMILMTVFFLILILAGSVNVQEILNKTIYHQRYRSIRILKKIELSLITFIKVKFFINLATGIATWLACIYFKIEFPLFWGLLTFAMNFIQFLGTVFIVVLLAIFGFVEIDNPGVLWLFILTISCIMVTLVTILEPIFMGKSFSINTITVLVMLMFWGYLWGIAGLILCIPISVFLKSIFEQFPNSKIIADIMSGADEHKLTSKVHERIFKK